MDFGSNSTFHVSWRLPSSLHPWRLMPRVRQVALALALCAATWPQTVQTPATFEVASVKRSGPESVRRVRGGPGTSDPGRYSFSFATLLDLIATAYDVEYFQISSSTPLDRDRFDISVTMPPNTTKEAFKAMLQELLAKRFDLRLHRGSRDFGIYELRIAKNGVKFRETSVANAAGEKPGIKANYTLIAGRQIVHITATKVTIPEFIETLRSSVELPMVDATGLARRYSFDLVYAKDLPGTTDEARVLDPPTLVTALSSQLGLTVEAKRASLHILIIDKISRTPEKN
jgi:uncharacterized protein (TIGR03435 family)